MLKKYFDWTPSDIAAWEKIRAGGLVRFMLWYGLKLFAGLLFLLVGGAIIALWLKDLLERQAGDIRGLALELLFAAAVCLLGGLVAGLATWALEEGIYRKLMKQNKD